jgi:uncharacterized protein
MTSAKHPLAIVTGASTGIGYELARCCAQNNFDLIVAADELQIEEASDDFRTFGNKVDAVQTDLATIEGVETLYQAVKGRAVDALLANPESKNVQQENQSERVQAANQRQNVPPKIRSAR